MPNTYVIADLHGRFDLLQMALDRIEADAGGEGGTVVFTGDYIDRGPQSCQIVQMLKAGAPPGWTWICLAGNHEDIMFQTLKQPLNKDWWFTNGGGHTIKSYWDVTQNDDAALRLMWEHVDWFDTLPLSYEDEHRMYVHAAALPDREFQSREVLQWMIYKPTDRDLGPVNGRHVVHGHHQFKEGPKLYANRSNFDTFAWYTGRLVVGVFADSLPGGPIGLLEVVGKSIDELRAAA